MSRLSRGALVGLALLVGALVVRGPGVRAQGRAPASYYVASTGSDSNPGTSAAPFRTVQAGVNAARPGDTIVVRDGHYGSARAGREGYPVLVRTAGSEGAPITLRAEHRWGAVLDCGGACHSYISLMNGAAYWVIQGFEVTRTRWGGVWANNGAAHHIRISGNHFHHIGNRFETSPYGIAGFYSNARSHDLVFDGNVFDDIGRTGGLPFPNHDHGIYSHAANVLVSNNLFYNMFQGWAIQLVDSASDWLIVNNTFAFPNPGRDGQIVLYGGNEGGSTTVTDIVIRNNIFYRPSGFAIVTNPRVPVKGCVIDHNLVYGASRVIDQPSWCVVGENLFGRDPLFVNVRAAPYDFRLRSGSPALSAGLNLSSVFVRDLGGRERQRPPSAWDLGAYR